MFMFILRHVFPPLTCRVRLRGQQGGGGGGGGLGMLSDPRVLGIIPNLLRTLASSAATIQGVQDTMGCGWMGWGGGQCA